MTHEAIEEIGCCASVVGDSLDPATDHTDTEVGFEALDYISFQVREDAVLIAWSNVGNRS
jgi:hypothetical protein